MQRARRLPALLLLAGLVPAAPAAAQDGVREGGAGVGVREGGELIGSAEAGKGRVTTVARYRDLCDVLTAAARQPGRPYKSGTLNFKGQDPWVADLICTFILNAAPHEGAKSPFTVPAERRRFVGRVLDALQKNAKLNTAAIARERILVGDNMYRLQLPRPKEGVTPERKSPERVKVMDVARSIERPQEILLGMTPQNFTVTGKKSEDLNNWIKAGELFVLRVHGLAETSRLLIEGDLDWGNREVGAKIPALSEAFKNKHSLLNTDAKGEWREWAQIPAADKTDEEKQKEVQTKRAREDETRVELEFADIQAPVRGVAGLSLFVYKPIPGAEREGGHNPRGWYLQQLAADFAAEPGEEGGQPGGITLPMYRFEPIKPDSIVRLDRLFDDETRAAVETRFTVMAVCVVRLLYYTDPVRGNTELARKHEFRHFDGIKDAWVAHTQHLRTALQRLAQELNQQLGLAGEEVYRFVEEPVLDTWRPADPKPGQPFLPDLTAIPVGPLQRASNASLFQPNDLKVQFVRMRLVRKIQAEQTGAPLLALLKSEKPLDPKFDDAKKSWDSWEKERWPEYKNAFVRQLLLSGLRLDLREGTLGDQGQSGRQRLGAVIKAFENATKDPKVDPDAQLKEILRKSLGK